MNDMPGKRTYQPPRCSVCHELGYRGNKCQTTEGIAANQRQKANWTEKRRVGPAVRRRKAVPQPRSLESAPSAMQTGHDIRECAAHGVQAERERKDIAQAVLKKKEHNDLRQRYGINDEVKVLYTPEIQGQVAEEFADVQYGGSGCLLVTMSEASTLSRRCPAGTWRSIPYRCQVPQDHAACCPVDCAVILNTLCSVVEFGGRFRLLSRVLALQKKQ